MMQFYDYLWSERVDNSKRTVKEDGRIYFSLLSGVGLWVVKMSLVEK